MSSLEPKLSSVSMILSVGSQEISAVCDRSNTVRLRACNALVKHVRQEVRDGDSLARATACLLADPEQIRRDLVEDMCARIKAADDASVCGNDYMLDSDDCIRVLRGTWPGPLANDMPAKPAKPVKIVAPVRSAIKGQPTPPVEPTPTYPEVLAAPMAVVGWTDGTVFIDAPEEAQALRSSGLVLMTLYAPTTEKK